MPARPIPLCRLRSCILLPKAELEVASRGTRPGPGAVDALEQAGEEGTVVAAFETGQGEGELHGIGVLARVRRVQPEQGGLDRYLLRGICRVLVDPAKIESKGGVPVIRIEVGPVIDLPEDGRSPPKELLDGLAELSTEWDSGEPWKGAFRLMARSPLAQWATSLATLLPLEQADRFALLDDPARLETVVREYLEQLLEVHSRRRVRAAVVQQAASRVTLSLPERMLAVPTNVAAWVMFHPDDLAHRAGDSARWWQTPAVTRELAAGTLLGVETGVDRFAFMVRFTGGELSSREAALKIGHADFRLKASRGRLFVGEPRHLPSVASELYPNVLADSFRWVDIPDGLYRVRVNAIAWRDEPGALNDDGSTSDHALSAYVAQVTPVSSLEEIPAPVAFPVLRSSR